jgi:hypothetical protein
MSLKDVQDAWREYPEKLRAMTNLELMNEGSFVFQGKSNFKISKVREEVYRRKQAGSWELPKDGFVRTGFVFEVVTRVAFSRSDLNLLIAHANPTGGNADILDRLWMWLESRETATIDLTIGDLNHLVEMTRIGTTNEIANDLLRALNNVDPPPQRDLRRSIVEEKANLNDKFWKLRDEAVQRQNEVNTIR